MCVQSLRGGPQTADVEVRERLELGNRFRKGTKLVAGEVKTLQVWAPRKAPRKLANTRRSHVFAHHVHANEIRGLA